MVDVLSLELSRQAMPHRLHSENLQLSWVDAYGHLNEGYYLVAFSNATWKLQDYFGVGTAYTEISGNALYTAETHLRYLREVRAPARLEVESYLFGSDAKKLHIGHILIVDGQERATVECVLVHVHSQTGRALPFTPAQGQLFEKYTEKAPDWVGSRVGLRKS